jgi:hypothetical protein
MKKSGQIITCGNFRVLRYVVKRTGIPGKWTKDENENRYQFRARNGAVLNYWRTTGTINFQGSDRAAVELRAMLLRRAIVIE